MSQSPDLEFPIIIKPNSATIKSYSHTFKMVVEKGQLHDQVKTAFETYTEDDALVIQSFINKSQYVVKCYSFGDQYSIQIQENLTEEEKLQLRSNFLEFKELAKGDLKQLEKIENALPLKYHERVGRMSCFLAQKSKLEILSIDFLAENIKDANGEALVDLMVIDMNYFCGIGQKNFAGAFRSLLKNRLLTISQF